MRPISPHIPSHISPTQFVRLQSLLDDAEHSLRHHLQDAYFAGEEGYGRLAIPQVMSDRELHELRDITAAHARMQDDSYGQCVECGADIPVARLLAYPTAKRCLDCQQQHEHQHPERAS